MLGALALLAAAQADKWVGEWLVWKDQEECIMSTEYVGGTMVTLAQSWRTKRISLRMSDPAWKSLADRGGEEVRADFHLVGKAVSYDKWWTDHAMIVAVPDKDLFAITAWWDGEKHDEDFWPAWALAEGVEIKVDGKIVGRFSLKDSYNASLELHRCSVDALNADRSDPFKD